MPGGNLRPVGGGRRFLRRAGLVARDRAVAELADAIAAPAPQRAVVFDARRCGLPGGNLRPVRGCCEFLRRADLVARDRAVAELAVAIAAPAPQRAVVFDGAGVAAPGGNLRPFVPAAHRPHRAPDIAGAGLHDAVGRVVDDHPFAARRARAAAAAGAGRMHCDPVRAVAILQERIVRVVDHIARNPCRACTVGARLRRKQKTSRQGYEGNAIAGPKAHPPPRLVFPDRAA